MPLLRPSALLAATMVLAGCYLPPDPPRASEGEGSGRGARVSDPGDRGAIAGDSLVDGAWRPAPPRDRSLPATSLTPRVANALSLGTWSAEVEPPGSEQLPDVWLRLRDLVLPGDAAGTAEYRFPGYRCRYALYVDSVEDDTIRLRQRLQEGRCAGPGRIVLVWESGESMVGEWVRPDGSPWFRARLSRTEDVSAVPDGSGGDQRSEIVP